jgi:hypothetical protein
MNKVVAHCQDGRVLKGTTSDFVPAKASFHLFAEGAPAPIEVQTDTLKALFFVRDLKGSPAHKDNYNLIEAPPGRRIRVEFKDGEVILGSTNGYLPGRPGFFVFPADAASNNERCYVVTAATRQIKPL